MADDGGLEGDDRAAAREGGRDLRRDRDGHAGTGTGGEEQGGREGPPPPPAVVRLCWLGYGNPPSSSLV